MPRYDSPTAITFLLAGIGIGSVLTLVLQRYRPTAQDPLPPEHEEEMVELMERTGRAV